MWKLLVRILKNTRHFNVVLQRAARTLCDKFLDVLVTFPYSIVSSISICGNSGVSIHWCMNNHEEQKCCRSRLFWHTFKLNWLSFTVSLDKNGHFFQRGAISKTKVLEDFEFDNNLHSLTLKTRFTMSIGQPQSVRTVFRSANSVLPIKNFFWGELQTRLQKVCKQGCVSNQTHFSCLSDLDLIEIFVSC